MEVPKVSKNPCPESSNVVWYGNIVAGVVKDLEVRRLFQVTWVDNVLVSLGQRIAN